MVNTYYAITEDKKGARHVFSPLIAENEEHALFFFTAKTDHMAAKRFDWHPEHKPVMCPKGHRVLEVRLWPTVV